MIVQGSIEHTTCEYQTLLDHAPDTIIPARPFSVHDRVYDAGDPLGGNFCPYNSSTPLQPCKKVTPTLMACVCLTVSPAANARSVCRHLCIKGSAVASKGRRGLPADADMHTSCTVSACIVCSPQSAVCNNDVAYSLIS